MGFVSSVDLGASSPLEMGWLYWVDRSASESGWQETPTDLGLQAILGRALVKQNLEI
jgi:hypothetical protein